MVRLARPDEATQFILWSGTTAQNNYDPKVAAYPSTLTWAVDDELGALAYLPVQRPVFMESLAVRPSASSLKIARAMRSLTLNTVRLAKTVGAGEIYTYSDYAPTQRILEGAGFEKVPFSLYRWRVSDAEARYGEQPPLGV
jgi:hypothetical protein